MHAIHRRSSPIRFHSRSSEPAWFSQRDFLPIRNILQDRITERDPRLLYSLAAILDVSATSSMIWQTLRLEIAELIPDYLLRTLLLEATAENRHKTAVLAAFRQGILRDRRDFQFVLGGLFYRQTQGLEIRDPSYRTNLFLPNFNFSLRVVIGLCEIWKARVLEAAERKIDAKYLRDFVELERMIRSDAAFRGPIPAKDERAHILKLVEKAKALLQELTA